VITKKESAKGGDGGIKMIAKKRKIFMKTILAATVIISSSTVLFQGLTQVAAAKEIEKKDIVMTSYDTISYQTAGESQSARARVPEGYVKANYTLTDNDLPYYRDKKPTDKDITRETAAEIGAQALWTVFDIDLEGKVLEMAYNPATADNRAIWEGCWWIDGKGKSTQNYFFSVDAVTGELHTVQYARTLKENASVGFDTTLAQNPQEYEMLARNVAEQYDVVPGAVKLAEYANQGTSSNDPTIDIRVTGENGEQAQISFSRYDKALLGIAYDSWCKEADVSAQNIEKEMQYWEEMSASESTENMIVPRQ